MMMLNHFVLSLSILSLLSISIKGENLRGGRELGLFRLRSIVSVDDHCQQENIKLNVKLVEGQVSETSVIKASFKCNTGTATKHIEELCGGSGNLCSDLQSETEIETSYAPVDAGACNVQLAHDFQVSRNGKSKLKSRKIASAPFNILDAARATCSASAAAADPALTQPEGTGPTPRAASEDTGAVSDSLSGSDSDGADSISISSSEEDVSEESDSDDVKTTPAGIVGVKDVSGTGPTSGVASKASGEIVDSHASTEEEDDSVSGIVGVKDVSGTGPTSGVASEASQSDDSATSTEEDDSNSASGTSSVIESTPAGIVGVKDVSGIGPTSGAASGDSVASDIGPTSGASAGSLSGGSVNSSRRL